MTQPTATHTSPEDATLAAGQMWHNREHLVRTAIITSIDGDEITYRIRVRWTKRNGQVHTKLSTLPHTLDANAFRDRFPHAAAN